MQVQSNFHISTFIHSFIHSFVHSFIHSFIQYKWHKPDVFAAERAISSFDAPISSDKRHLVQLA